MIDEEERLNIRPLIRRAEAADAPEMARLKRLLMEDGWPFDITFEPDWDAHCIEIAQSLVADPRYRHFVIDQTPGAGPGSPIAAGVSVSWEQHLPGPWGGGRSGYLGDMSTDPAFRGRGYGTALLDFALDWLRAEGVGWASLYSTPSGNRLYEKAGFEKSADGSFSHMSIGLHGE